MASSVVAHLPGSLTLALLEPAFATPTAAPRCTSSSPSFWPLPPSKPNVGSSAVPTRLLYSNRHSSAALWQNRSSWQAVCKSASPSQQVVEEQDGTEDDTVPTPVVVIDQDSDPEATVVELSFGDRLGALLDTMKALKDLGLNVVKSRISVEGAITRKRFSITRVDTGRKVDDPELMEAIRLTIINNMLKYHPESSVQLAMGNAFGIKPPTKQLDIDIATHIYIYDDGPHRSLLCIETADRPGLLMEIVKVIKDVSISFESGEFDTEGLVAKAKFHVNYRGAALSKPLQEVLRNCLRYFLRRPETNEDSY